MVKQVILDCVMLSERTQAHEYLAKLLQLPDYYGKNLDALFDCLTEFGECTILLKGKESIQGTDGYAGKVLKVLEDAARENPCLEIISAP